MDTNIFASCQEQVRNDHYDFGFDGQENQETKEVPIFPTSEAKTGLKEPVLDNASGPRKRKRSSSAETADASPKAKTPAPGLCEPRESPRLRLPNHTPGKCPRTGVPRPPHVFQGKLHGLSAALWQRIFSFVPPVFLGVLLRVSREFYFLLSMINEGDPSLGESCTQGNLQPLASNAIWAASRKRFAPGLPQPLPLLKDLDMWRLLRGNACQLCGQRKALITNAGNPDLWHNGPGNNGVRVIWPLGIRSCGSCLITQCEQVGQLEISLHST